jgi:hypothetical protein
LEFEEIRRCLDVSVAHSVTIDVVEVSEAPGNLRAITIHSDNRVTIEFQRCAEYIVDDWEGGGLKYVGRYDSLESAVQDLQLYLDKPVREWRNYTRERYEPVITAEADSSANWAYFENLVREGKMLLPEHGRFEIAGVHWRHVRRYGTYRPDKLLEEQELTLREGGFEPDDDS